MKRAQRKEKRKQQMRHEEPQRFLTPKPVSHAVTLTGQHKLYREALRCKSCAPVFCIGSAGTGKTYGALEAAMEQLESRQIQRIVVLRPQESFAAKSGYLPGTEREKQEPWVRPILQNLRKLGYSDSQIEHMEKVGILCFYDLGMVQGLTFDNSLILVDEPQNMTYEQFQGVLTREGRWSRTVFCGDVAQTSPMFKNSGLPKLLDMVDAMNADVHLITMTRDDVVRGPRCKQWIMDFEDYDAGIRLTDYQDEGEEERLPLYD